MNRAASADLKVTEGANIKVEAGYGLGGAAGVASALGFDFSPAVFTATTR
jgi:hypothetical protein